MPLGVAGDFGAGILLAAAAAVLDAPARLRLVLLLLPVLVAYPLRPVLLALPLLAARSLLLVRSGADMPCSDSLLTPAVAALTPLRLKAEYDDADDDDAAAAAADDDDDDDAAALPILTPAPTPNEEVRCDALAMPKPRADAADDDADDTAEDDVDDDDDTRDKGFALAPPAAAMEIDEAIAADASWGLAAPAASGATMGESAGGGTKCCGKATAGGVAKNCRAGCRLAASGE